MSEFDNVGGMGATAKAGGDVEQMQGVGNFMGDQADNSEDGWGTLGAQGAGGGQAAMGGEVTDNVDIGAINISS